MTRIKKRRTGKKRTADQKKAAAGRRGRTQKGVEKVSAREEAIGKVTGEKTLPRKTSIAPANKAAAKTTPFKKAAVKRQQPAKGRRTTPDVPAAATPRKGAGRKQAAPKKFIQPRKTSPAARNKPATGRHKRSSQ